MYNYRVNPDLGKPAAMVLTDIKGLASERYTDWGEMGLTYRQKVINGPSFMEARLGDHPDNGDD